MVWFFSAVVLLRPCSKLWLLFISSCLFLPLTPCLALTFLWYMAVKYWEGIKLYVASALLCDISCFSLCSHLHVFCNGPFTIIWTDFDFNGRNSRYHGRLLKSQFLGRVLGNFSNALGHICACVRLLLAAGNPPKWAVFLCIVSFCTVCVDKVHTGKFWKDI